MAEQLLKDKIRDLLKRPDADSIHVVVVSKKFKGVRLKEKHDLIWSELIRKLTRKEWGRVTLSVGVTPEEIKALA
jgi:acid stress-induced BolA-like protein IbaG/YrbA